MKKLMIMMIATTSLLNVYALDKDTIESIRQPQTQETRLLLELGAFAGGIALGIYLNRER